MEFNDRRVIGVIRAKHKDGTSLHPTPDLQGQAGIEVHNVNEIPKHAAGKFGHYPNVEDYTFRRAKVDHYEFQHLQDGYPVGDPEHFPVGYTFPKRR